MVESLRQAFPQMREATKFRPQCISEMMRAKASLTWLTDTPAIRDEGAMLTINHRQRKTVRVSAAAKVEPERAVKKREEEQLNVTNEPKTRSARASPGW